MGHRNMDYQHSTDTIGYRHSVAYGKRRTRHKETLYGRIAATLLIVGIIALFKAQNIHHETNLEEFDVHSGRRLLQADNQTSVITSENCTPRSIEQFPPDFMTLKQRQNGGVVAHIVIVIYIFAALAIVCDDYFVASLEKICTVMKLQPDVAGATFMAAGSSAPELFTSIVGVFFAKSDVGLGTIVGSAVFNILFIIAICALFSGMVIYLTWWPLFRDATFYLVSIICLVGVIYDNQVTWYESMIMLILYILYIILMYFNPRLGDFMIEKVDNLRQSCCVNDNNTSSEPSEKTPLLDDEQVQNDKPSDVEKGYKVENASGLPVPGFHHTVSRGDSTEKLTRSGESVRSKHSVYSDHVGFERSGQALPLHDEKEDNDDDDEFVSPFAVPKSIPKLIFWVIMLPVSVLLFVTIPDCRRPGCWQKTFAFTFLMSVVWIAGMSYIMVWMVTIIGDTLGIPDTVMGLTFLAAGTSVPDALASLFVAKDGYGDMAVSNSIGSNVFDILMCLGLPWLLETAAVAGGQPLEITSKGLIFTAITLFLTVVFLIVSLGLNGWRLNKKFGVLCIVVYVVVITFSCLYESNVFTFVNLPPCPRS